MLKPLITSLIVSTATIYPESGWSISLWSRQPDLYQILHEDHQQHNQYKPKEGCLPCSLYQWNSISYPLDGGNYTLSLTKEGVLQITSPGNTKRVVHTAKIDFSSSTLLKLGAWCSGKNEKLEGAMNGIMIEWIKSIIFSPINIQFSLRFKGDSVDYVFSVPTRYFEDLLKKSSRKEIWFDKNAVEEIYGEAQNSLTSEDRKLYQKLEWYIKHLVIGMK